MRRTTIVLTALTLGVIGVAHGTRVLEQPEDAYELLLGEVVLPSTAAGYVMFKPCAECPTKSLGVGVETAYFIKDSPATFEDFSNAAEGYRHSIGGNESTGVFVFYDVATERVNRLVLMHFGE